MGANSPYWVTVRVLAERVVRVSALSADEARAAAIAELSEVGVETAGVVRVDYEEPES